VKNSTSRTKGTTYLGPADIVGQFSGVQNSVNVPKSRFTWLKKSTAAPIAHPRIYESIRPKRILIALSLSQQKHKSEKNFTVDSQPLKKVFSRRETHSLPQVATS
jgi:hypothetical protein